VILNMSGDARLVALPKLPGRHWGRTVDTALASPEDVAAPASQRVVEGDHYVAQSRSVAVLEAH
jgi:hypothetical protein